MGKQTRDRLVQWLEQTVNRDYIEKVSLVCLYGSHINGTAAVCSSIFGKFSTGNISLSAADTDGTAVIAGSIIGKFTTAYGQSRITGNNASVAAGTAGITDIIESNRSIVDVDTAAAGSL